MEKKMFQKSNGISSIIGPDLEISGDINIKGDLLIYGKVIGNIHCEGLLTMNEGSVVEGNISTCDALVNGRIDGDLSVIKKACLNKKSKLLGNLKTSILIVHEGASLNGKCAVSKSSKKTYEGKNIKVANLNEGNKS